MKQYSKLAPALLQDPRIRHLLDEQGLSGLGLYLLLRLDIEHSDGYPKDKLLVQGTLYTGRNKLEKVLHNYGLFEEDATGLIHLCNDTVPIEPPATLEPLSTTEPIAPPQPPAASCAPARELARELARGLARGPLRGPVPGHEPSIEFHIKEASVVCVRDVVREWLMAESNLPWRESVMMQSGFSYLLMHHWEEAIDFFLQHATAQDELRVLTSEHDVRRYFANYCKASKPTGRALMEYLQSMTQSQVEHQKEENNLWN